MTFTLPGFNTVKREGIELSGTFTATIDAELRVGAIEETITVTGETPIVDVQSAHPAAVIDRDLIDAPPDRHGLSFAQMAPDSWRVGGCGESGRRRRDTSFGSDRQRRSTGARRRRGS